MKSSKRSESRAESDCSHIVSSSHGLYPNKSKYFSKRKSAIGRTKKTDSKRSPSITMLKKKKVISKTNAHNSPMIRSTDSLHFRSKSKPKLRKKVSQMSTITGDRTLDSFLMHHPKTVKSGLLKSKRKAMISKFCKKTVPNSKNSSPKHSKLRKTKYKKHRFGGVSSRRTSAYEAETQKMDLSKDSKRPLAHKVKKHSKNKTFVSSETQAHIPSTLNVKKSFNRDRKSVQIFMMPGSDSHFCSTAKSSFVKYRDTKLKSKLSKHLLTNKSTDMKLYKGLDKPRGHEYKKTEFIIPKNLSRKGSEDKDALSKYLKENPSVQSCSIHINELLNSKKLKKQKHHQKSMSISHESSLARMKASSSSKPSWNKNSSLERPRKEGLIQNQSHIKIPKTSQSNYPDIIPASEKFNLKKNQVYLMKKSCKRDFSK